MGLAIRGVMRMPKLRSVRVVNAQFNEGRGLYQDFRMPFYGRNGTYELGNGMGKSVLLMLILQCVLPNAAPDPNKPFKYMFAGGERNRTTHVLAEWELDEVVDGRRYLLTGFCAKRKSDQEDEGESDEIKYFSYLHLYGGPNDLDIDKIPLCREEGADFFTQDYSETRKMLREKAKAGYDIWIAETRQQYLERLKDYYLIESEWELIKLINRQESYLKTHFHSFRDSRAFVEDLLIKMIDRCLQDRRRLKFHGGDEDPVEKALADSLYQSQEDLRKLQAEQARLHEYEHLLNEISILQTANDRLLRSYRAYEEARQRAASQHVAYVAAIARTEEESRQLQEQILGKRAACESVQNEIEGTGLKLQNVRLNLSGQRLKRAETEKVEHEQTVNTLKHRADFARAVNKYLSIREREAEIREREEIMRKMEEEHQELFARLRPLGKTLHTLVAAEKERVSGALLAGQSRAKETHDENMSLQRDLGGARKQAEGIRRRITELERQSVELEAREKELVQRHERCPKVPSWFSRPDQIEATEKRLAAEKETHKRLASEISEIERRLSTNQALEPELAKGMADLDRAIETLQREITNFTAEKGSARQIAEIYELDDIEACTAYLKDRREQLREMLAGYRSRREDLIRDLESAEKYGITLSREYLAALERLQEKYPTAISGAEHLKGISDDERRECLANAPWLPKAALLLKGDFEAVVRNPMALPAQVQDATIVITSIDHLRERRPLSLGDVYISSRMPEQSLEALASDRAAEHLRKEIRAINEEIQKADEALVAITRDSDALSRFINRYPPEFEQERAANLGEHLRQMGEGTARLAALRNQLQEDDSALPRARTNLAEQEKAIGLFEKKLALLTDLVKVTEEREKTLSNLQQEHRNAEETEALQRQIEAAINRCDSEFKRLEEINNQLKERLRKVEQEISEYRPYASEDVPTLPDADIDRLRSEYRSARQVVDRVVKDRESYERDNARDRKQIEDDQNDISSYRISIEEIEAGDPEERYSSEYIQEVDRSFEDAERLLKEAIGRYEDVRGKHHLLFLEMEEAERKFNAHAPEAYTRDPDLINPEPLKADQKRLEAESLTLKEELAHLDAMRREGEKVLEGLITEYNGYELLDSTHPFIKKGAAPASELRGYRYFQEELAAAVGSTTKQKERFSAAKDQFFRNVDEINVPHYFIETVRGKIRIAESAGEATSIQQSLEGYAATVTGWAKAVQAQVEGLLEVETKIIDQALGMAITYRDYLMMVPRLSKIEIDGNPREMLQINFEDCTYRDEVARGEMHRYIQDLTAHIQDGTLSRGELGKALAPGQLVGRVMDMGRIRVKIRKIDIDTYPFQLWEKIKASEGQENTMHIILLVVLISTIRAIVVGRHDRNTAKVLFVDNPFGSTGSYYLWEKIWSILDRNNVQMICSGHKIDAKVREFFPISYLLTSEISAGGRMRIVGVRFVGAGKDLDRLERQKRGEILAWTEE
jgi:DNA repair exonuclease SbcCD ATPase subunit/uncharacterized membrane protein